MKMTEITPEFEISVLTTTELRVVEIRDVETGMLLATGQGFTLSEAKRRAWVQVNNNNRKEES